MNYFTEVYKNEQPEVREYMELLCAQLEDDYGEIPNSWRISLDLIRDWMIVYVEAKKKLKEDGVMSEGARDRTIKAPQFTVMNLAYHNIYDLLKHFNTTPLSKGKLKKLENTNKEQDEDLSVYFDKLMS